MKKAKFLLPVILFFALCLLPVNAVSSDRPIIIDHSCTDIWQIPAWAIAQAKSTLHIAYGHTSHGSQLISGMGSSGTQLDAFMTSNDATPGMYVWHDGPQAGALDLDDYFVSGDLGNPDRVAWAQRTRDYLNNPANSDVNVVIWSWCGQVDGSEADINTYLNLMNLLEAEYPDVTFVYMTGHLNGTGASGNVNVRNNQIRDFCIANNKVLYDFADIESYDPDGLANFMALYANDNCDYDSDGNGSLDRNWALDWQNSHTLNVDWWMSGAAHSQHLNGNRKGYAAWWLWASLAGWNRCVPAPSSLTVTPDSGTREISLDWTDNSIGTNEDAFIIARQVNGGAWNNDYASVGPNITSFTDSGLYPGTYGYRVSAYLADNGDGNPCQSGSSNVGTADIVLQEPPDPPSDLSGTADSNGCFIHITWSDNSNNETGFVLLKKKDDGLWNETYAVLSSNTTSYTDSDLLSGVYVYRIKAYNDYGDSLLSDETTDLIILDIPSAPTNLIASGDSINGTVSLSWTDNSGNEDRFIIARRVNSGAWVNAYDTVGANVTSYIDTNQGAPPLTNGTYTYRVSASNSDGVSSPSNEASAVISSASPDAPSNLDSTLNGFDIDLTWTDNSGNEECFVLERQIDGGEFSVLADSIPANTTSYLDAGLAPYHTYTYRVMARNNYGDSAFSNETWKYIAEETFTITLKEGVDGYIGCRDAYLDAASPTLNYGNDPYNYVRNNSKINFLISFDMPSQVLGKQIVEARIGFYCWTVSSYTAGQYLDLYNVTETWIEGTADGAYQEGSTSWDVRCCADLWATPGGTVDSQILGQSLIPNSTYYPEFDITDLVQQWVDGTTENYGVLLRNDSTVVTGIKASEYSEYGRPYLVITYTNKSTRNLTVSSTDGGSVTQPGEGLFIYDDGMVVDLIAVAETGYQFVNWTGDVADSNAPATMVTMNADKSVSANFAPHIVYVANIAMSSVSLPGGNAARAVVLIKNMEGNPVSGAAVTGAWSGLVSGGASGVTGSDGTVSFTTRKTKSSGVITFTVTNVSVSGYVYDPAHNAETQDSITIGQTTNEKPVADAAASPVTGKFPLTVNFNGSGSYDPDGTITSYTWDFGDGASAGGATAAHVYTSIGAYAATLTVTDNQGASDSATVLITVTSESLPKMYVSAIDMRLQSAKGGNVAEALVTVLDENGLPVTNAAVTGTWSGLSNMVVTGVTDINGTVILTSTKSKKSGAFTLTVADVTADGFLYAPILNVETIDSIVNQ